MTEIKPIHKKDKIFRNAQFSENYDYIIDSDGKKIELDDPRIVYVNPEPRNEYGSRLVVNLYEKANRSIRVSGDTNPTILQYAKKVCSGRECLASVGIAGAVIQDMCEKRTENEITIYKTPIDQHGPCQNGAWPVLWDTFSERLRVKNVIFCAYPKYTNKYLGLNADLIVWENINFVIGHYLTEARNVLYCAAENRDQALNTFEEITAQFINNVKEEKKTLNTGLLKWAREVAKIPLKRSIKEIPKVLIFGGLNLMFDHYPIEEFFLENGVISKVIDIVESMNLILAESSIRFGFKKGLLSPKEQFNEDLLNAPDLNEAERKEAARAIRNRKTMKFLDSQCKIYRKIIGRSGLLFDSFTSFTEIFELGNTYVSSNNVTETTLITGRYLNSLKGGIYDGLVNLGTFNCQPAMNSQAIIRPLANKSDIPYAAIDCEGPWISTNQRRLLETIALQAKRLREQKNKEIKQ